MLNTALFMQQIREHPIVATISIAAGTILASEVIWKAVKFFHSQLSGKRPLRVHEVLSFNELGDICAAQHLRKSMPGSPELTKSPEPIVLQCRNMYCSLRNVGKIVEQIDRAVYSLDVAIYTFSSLILADAFKRALQRGVSVRIISDREMVFSSGSQINVLACLGVPVRMPITSKMMHNKYCVIDGVERVEEIRRLKQRKWIRPYCSVVVSGSVNWTRQGFGGNWENCILSEDKELARMFQADFTRMWKAFEKSENNLKQE
ncbi:mitochondrial cardiolipin hydrolase [Drosophila rhopaloa]|uniref:Mitochondrial cardiolipin hydrolase n=1 Tax=Drosophila rhopaloa TaxID=1041015 RepID=A0A6P4ERI6_DRORH|nr:mitochondrial cardiolipin hydrolase [Drosophila rhopaloa]